MKINYTLNVLFTFFTLTVFAQTIVSTNPENKKVVLEEFTGITLRLLSRRTRNSSKYSK